MTARAEAIFDIAIINRTRAEIVLSSITPYGDTTRLDSIYSYFPKMVLGERNRHRAFSLSDRSSRAVPPEKLIEEIRSGIGLAMPAKFKQRIKGMGGGEEFSGDELISAQLRWIDDALDAADRAEVAASFGEAKETVNRRLDDYIYIHTLQTATRDGWMNFFGLRLDAGADPTIQVLAQKCFEAYRASTPKLLQPGEWHLPFVDEESWRDCAHYAKNVGGFPASKVFGYTYQSSEGRKDQLERTLEIAKRLSAARCAHLSYNDLQTGSRMSIERALSIYDRLINSRPVHASPVEHQACVDEVIVPGLFGNPDQCGNLVPGWRQARKMIPGESVADLPEGYLL